MAEIKFTKTELRNQQNRLNQLQRYLPTLQLKKAMLQAEVQEVRTDILRCEQLYQQQKLKVSEQCCLLADSIAFDPLLATKILKVNKHIENIAGVEFAVFESVTFEEYPYSLYDTPPWLDAVIAGLQKALSLNCETALLQEKKNALENELRQVSIRVNLFEKILIPKAQKNIKRIRVFLGDQQLAAVSQAKVAKTKIDARCTIQEPSYAF